MRYGLGLGSSGAAALDFVDDALRYLSDADEVRVLAISERYGSAPQGGVTDAPFVNAAVVVESELSGAALLGWLLSVERRFGRVRGARYGGRSLDLDVLWCSGPPRTRPDLVVPHPRLQERAFALRPLLEAFASARMPPPIALLKSARGRGREILRRLAPPFAPEE